jgi:hypothetical protein
LRNDVIWLELLRKASPAREVVQLPMRSQITFGGHPARTLRSEKSESLLTIANSFSKAKRQTWSYGALSSPQFSTWADPGKRSPIDATSRGDRFSSRSSFTL